MSTFESTVAKSTPLSEALKLMGASPQNKHISGIVVVVDQERKVVGVLSDGDIRRGLSRGLALSAPVGDFCNSNPIVAIYGAEKVQMRRDIIQQARDRGRPYQSFTKIILVDENRRFKDLVWLSDIAEEQIDDKTIAVHGMGFVGLTLATVLASEGLHVVGIETNRAVVAKLRESQPTFFENGLESLLTSLNSQKRISFHESLDAAPAADIHIVSVGTPISDQTKPDLEAVRSVTTAIAAKLKKGDLVVFRSTLPAGTMRHFVIPILQKSGMRPGDDFYVAFAPERTIEGNALAELRSLPQIIGGYDHESTQRAARVFRRMTSTIVEVESLEAAEMVKLINNTYRDVVFSFANEVAKICDNFNLNAFKLIQSANEGYPRNPVPMPSPGVGGLCLSKDPFLYSNPVAKLDFEPKLGLASRSINSTGHIYVLDKLRRYAADVGKDLGVMKIFLIGLAFKGMPATSDIRDSVALKLLQSMPNLKNVYVKDFVVSREEIAALGVTPVDQVSEGFKDADAVVVMNNHYENNKFNISRALRMMRPGGFFFDGWNMFDQSEIEGCNDTRYATMGYLSDVKHKRQN